jgi:hypothetical protein
VKSDLYAVLVLGSYAFTAAAFGWAWVLYKRTVDRVDTLWQRVHNHAEHRIQDVERRLKRLER